MVVLYWSTWITPSKLSKVFTVTIALMPLPVGTM